MKFSKFLSSFRGGHLPSSHSPAGRFLSCHALATVLTVTALSSLVATTAQAASSLSQHGITWYFDKDYTTGTFFNGDHWVVGPVTITRITPEWNGKEHGSEVNPGFRESKISQNGGQGWYDGLGSGIEYSAERNVADNLPLTLQPGNTLVSSRGNSTEGGDGRKITVMSALTVLASPPPANSFRPPYAGTDKSIPATTADINYDAFPDLVDPRVSTPSATSFVSSGGGYLYIDVLNQWPNSTLKTENSLPNYGRQISYVTSKAALWLCLNNPDSVKSETMTHMIQRGIDVYGLLENGMYWSPNGGHNSGRKLMLAVAALALGHDAMMEWVDGDANKFQEDGQHDYITQRDVDHTQEGDTPFTQAQLDNWNGTGGPMPEWFSSALSLNERDNSGAEWDKAYRSVTGGPNTGTALAVYLLGLTDEWNDPSFFDYIQNRYWPAEQGRRQNALNQIHLFPAAMWDNYGPGSTFEPQAKVATPVVSPLSADSVSPVHVSIATATPGATIYYTTDDSPPTTNSERYVAPFVLGSSTVVRAIATKPDLLDSNMGVAGYAINSFESFENEWKNISLPVQPNGFNIAFDMVAEATPIDGVTGISFGAADRFQDLACIVRFAPTGRIDARNGGGYQAVSTLEYVPGTVYRVAMNVDLPSHRYSVTVTPQGGAPVVIAENYNFRSDQASVQQLNNLALTSVTGTHTVFNVVHDPSPLRPTAPKNPSLVFVP